MLDAAQITFVREAAIGVVASVAPDGEPQAATVKMTADACGAVLFATLRTSRKATNLQADPRFAIVVQQPGASLQIEGTVEEPRGPEAATAREQYLAEFPEEVERAHGEEFALLRAIPTWARMTDYRTA